MWNKQQCIGIQYYNNTYCDTFIKIVPLCSQRDDYSMHKKCAVCEYCQYWSQYVWMTCRRCYLHFICCYNPLFSNNPKASLMCHISLATYYWKQDKWYSNSTPFKRKHTVAWLIFSYIRFVYIFENLVLFEVSNIRIYVYHIVHAMYSVIVTIAVQQQLLNTKWQRSHIHEWNITGEISTGLEIDDVTRRLDTW